VIEAKGDIWEYHKRGLWVVITVNGVLDRDGRNVMGAGVACQAKEKYPGLPKKLGNRIIESGNKCYAFPEFKIITYPTKHHWKDKHSDLMLIQLGAHEIAGMVRPSVLREPLTREFIAMVRPGVGCGKLDWEQVKGVIAPILDDQFIVVSKAD
jgi:hypothetical protein